MSKKNSACISDWKEVVWPSSGKEMMGSCAEKIVALFSGRTHKPKFKLKGRSDNIITIQNNRRIFFSSSKPKISASVFNNGANAMLTV
jgi:hypothetical protein